jgi:tripartite-type tricarboxylate transporter receptor subunit TctC
LEALKSPNLQAKYAAQGAEPGSMSQPEFAKFVETELVRWNNVVTAANVRLE